jgi:Glycosyl-hydrolase 97 N-terminal
VRAVACILLACAAFAQDERRVTSPDGQIEFRLFIATQSNSNLSRIGYEVLLKGKPLINTSFLGLDIQDQEPLLGENVGLTSSASAASEKYNSLIAKYMQNGSLGRLIDVEVRAYNEGVAFRYVIPQSTPLVEILIAEEATEFRLADPSRVSITESKSEAYPPMRVDQTTMMTRLARPYKGTTPLTCPWRIISLRPAIVRLGQVSRPSKATTAP